MQGLYSRLFRYRSRPDRQPLEDFLSEALADILTRMPREILAEFLDWCFRDARSTPDWNLLCRSRSRVATQVPAAGGIADLVLYSDERPALVIENKTWSGFRDHGTPGRPANQMTTYCEWLRDESGGKPCAALLITGTSDAPEGYHEGGNYAVDARAQITWASLARWFLSCLPPDGPSTRYDLSLEFVEFIKEKGLSSEVFTQADLAAISLALPTMDRWDATLRSLWSASEDIRQRFLNKQVSRPGFNVEAGMYWQWRYGQPKTVPKKAWVGLGLRLPEVSQWYRHLELPSSPHLVMILGSDAGLLIYREKLPQGWCSDEEDGQFVLGYPMHELPLDSGRRVDALHRWMREALAGAESILATAKLK